MSSRVTVRLDAALTAELQAFCTTHGFTPAVLVRQGLRQVLTQDPKTLRPRPPAPVRPARKKRKYPSVRSLVLAVFAAADGPLHLWEVCKRLPRVRLWPRAPVDWFPGDIDATCRRLKAQGRLGQTAPLTFAWPPGIPRPLSDQAAD
jgi:hypothetical protein